MKQILQNLGNGETEVAEVPEPGPCEGRLLIRTSYTMISPGTERMLLDFGRSGLIQKARQQPDKVRVVLDKARTDGVLTTLQNVRDKLGQPVSLGYCNVGTVIDTGGSSSFFPGDRVVSNGAHAGIVSVPHNLCAKIPSGVSDASAVFTVLTAIGLQGVRLLQPTLGEAVVVSGLGLIGLLTVQLLIAHGCRVLAVDFDRERLALARSFGAVTASPSSDDELQSVANEFSRGRGVDGVILSAATQSSKPVSQAANMCRKRGRIVLVGVTGLDLSRADFYEKELTFQVSCSYGPGRYDSEYEQKGIDYPIGFVRWTEQRNFEAVLDLLDQKKLVVDRLISHEFEIKEATIAYDMIADRSPSLGILLRYDQPPGQVPVRTVRLPQTASPFPSPPGAPSVVVVGAGNYSSRVLVPAFRESGARLHTLVSAGGVSSLFHGRKNQFESASTDWKAAIAAPDVDAVVVATRHNQHASQVLASMKAGKHVFCEKPLCLDLVELDEIQAEADRRPHQMLMVGFNRRFATASIKMKAFLDGRPGQKHVLVTVNAGQIPLSHWTQDPRVGGGRIVGEACHFIDLVVFFCGALVKKCTVFNEKGNDGRVLGSDRATIVLEMEDGSIGTVVYLSTGHNSFPKERVEVFSEGAVARIDNFKKLEVFGSETRTHREWRQDKGQVECVKAFVAAIEGAGASPIPIGELLHVSRISIEAQRQIVG